MRTSVDARQMTLAILTLVQQQIAVWQRLQEPRDHSLKFGRAARVDFNLMHIDARFILRS